jgi:hypothetical protein
LIEVTLTYCLLCDMPTTSVRVREPTHECLQVTVVFGVQN